MARATAEVDLEAIRLNCALLDSKAGTATLCAVVKANGYGHGMLEVARAAQEGGASWLAVAAGSEALELRHAGIGGRILVMGVVGREEVEELVSASCDLVAWSDDLVEWALRAETRARLHVKFDTGMGRLGTRSLPNAVRLALRVEDSDGVELIGGTTHFATADAADPSFMREQNAKFTEFVEQVRGFAPEVIAHAANSAATLGFPESHHDMVRCGIGIYGLDPFGADPAVHGLIPALGLKSWLGTVKETAAGESVGYGQTFIAETPTVIGTVPIGYADGVRRLLGGGADALVGGRRVPIVGNVSMDNITLDLGQGATDSVGSEVILLGSDGENRLLVEDWARAAQTINYEIATGLGGRTSFEYRGKA